MKKKYLLYGVAVALVGEALDRIVTHWPALDAAVHVGYLALVAGLVAWLRCAVEEARALARTDALTGAPNRRTFMETTERELERMRRRGGSLTLLYIDIDRFKQINDTLGHAVGDRVLRAVAQTLAAGLRSGDSYARLGGDEFVVLLEGDRYVGLLARLRGSLKHAAALENWDIGFSIGAVTFHAAPGSAEAMLRRADGVMYEAKQQGDRLIHRVA